MAKWIEQQDPSIVYLQGTHFRPQDTYRCKVKGWKDSKQTEARKSRSTNTSIKQNRLQKVTRNKGCYLVIQGSVPPEDVPAIKICAPSIGALKYIKQILTGPKGETDS